MNDNTNLFIVEEDNTIKINKVEVRLIPEYRELLVRDKGSPGDVGNRKKLKALKEFLFIYMYLHPASLYRDLPDKDRFEKAKNLADLPSDWKMDKEVQAACERFKEDLQMSALHYSYVNANRGVYGIGQDLAFLNNRRDTLRKNIEFNTDKLNNTEKDEDRLILYKQIEYDTNMLLDTGNKIMNLTNGLPNAFKTVEDLKKKLAEEGGNTNEIYGGGTLGNREA